VGRGRGGGAAWVPGHAAAWWRMGGGCCSSRGRARPAAVAPGPLGRASLGGTRAPGRPIPATGDVPTPLFRRKNRQTSKLASRASRPALGGASRGWMQRLWPVRTGARASLRRVVVQATSRAPGGGRDGRGACAAPSSARRRRGDRTGSGRCGDIAGMVGTGRAAPDRLFLRGFVADTIGSTCGGHTVVDPAAVPAQRWSLVADLDSAGGGLAGDFASSRAPAAPIPPAGDRTALARRMFERSDERRVILQAGTPPLVPILLAAPPATTTVVSSRPMPLRTHDPSCGVRTVRSASFSASPSLRLPPGRLGIEVRDHPWCFRLGAVGAGRRQTALGFSRPQRVCISGGRERPSACEGARPDRP
jgi:hypothetical protein